MIRPSPLAGRVEMRAAFHGLAADGCAVAPQRHAVTITELLVVVAIMTLLLGLLLPGLFGVRAAARSTRCRANLRQMALAAQHYASIHQEWPPAIIYEPLEGGGVKQVAWDWVTSGFGGEAIEPGPLWTFLDDPGSTMQCPDYHGETNFADPHTGYNYSTGNIGDEQVLATGAIRRGTPPHACSRGSQCAMFGDGGRAGGTNKFMRGPLDTGWPLATIYAGGQAFRHGGGTTNVAYVDGHVAEVSQPREGERATPILLRYMMGFPENGFLSEDDSAYRAR